MKTNWLITCILIFSLPLISFEQSLISLENPSFEGKSGVLISKHWNNCEAITKGPYYPYLISYHYNPFNIEHSPQHKNTFLSLVTRTNGTSSATSQNLNYSLKEGKYYKFSLYLSMSAKFLSRDRISNKKVSFSNPIVFELWGGHSKCTKKELLGKTKPINHKEWIEYEFYFKVDSSSINTLIFQANFKDSTLYNGHLLLDNCSSIEKISKSKFKKNIVIKEHYKSNHVLNSRFDLYNIIRDSSIQSQVKKLSLVHLGHMINSSFIETVALKDEKMIYYIYGKASTVKNKEETMFEIINTLNKLKMPKSSKVIWRIKDVRKKYNKNKHSTIGFKVDELQYLDNAQEILNQSLINEKLHSKIESFINENKKEIYLELKRININIAE